MRSIFLFLLLSSFHFTKSQQLTSGGKLKPEQAIMDVRHYTIALAVDINNKSISGYTSIDVVLTEPAPVLLFNLMNDFTVQKVWVNNKATLFTHTNELIRIRQVQSFPQARQWLKFNMPESHMWPLVRHGKMALPGPPIRSAILLLQ